MELLKEFAPEFAQHQMNDKALLFENEKYQAVPEKYKLLAGQIILFVNLICHNLLENYTFTYD